MGLIHPNCNKVDMNAANLDKDADILHFQYNTVLDKNLDDLSFLNPNKVKEAFNSMNSYNAGGPDRMKSIVFQNMPYNILIRISKIYQACIKLSYTPSTWCESDVIFLPKPEKPRYDLPNSFRPISKLNVILKGLEKLVKWELERTSLSKKPLHNKAKRL